MFNITVIVNFTLIAKGKFSRSVQRFSSEGLFCWKWRCSCEHISIIIIIITKQSSVQTTVWCRCSWPTSADSEQQSKVRAEKGFTEMIILLSFCYYFLLSYLVLPRALTAYLICIQSIFLSRGQQQPQHALSFKMNTGRCSPCRYCFHLLSLFSVIVNHQALLHLY